MTPCSCTHGLTGGMDGGGEGLYALGVEKRGAVEILLWFVFVWTIKIGSEIGADWSGEDC